MIRACSVAVCWFFLAFPSPALSQVTVTFDPSRHLPGFDECSFSEYASLYQLGEFEKKAREVIPVADLQRLQQEWEAEKRRVEAEIGLLRKDPALMARFRFDREIARDGVLAGFKLEKVADDGPVVVYCSKLEEATAFHLTDLFASACQLARAVCNQLPNALEPILGRRLDPPPLVPILMLSIQQFKQVWATHRIAQYSTFLGSFDPQLKAVVCEFEPDKPPFWSKTVLYETTMLLLHHWSSSPAADWKDWILEGLSCWSAQFDAVDGKLVTGVLQRQSFETLVSMLADEQTRTAFTFSAAELMQRSAVSTRERCSSVPRPASIESDATYYSEVLYRFQLQSALFVDFLLHSKEGELSSILSLPLCEMIEPGLATQRSITPSRISSTELQSKFVAHLKAKLAEALPGTLISNEWFTRAATKSSRAGDPVMAANGSPAFQPAELSQFQRSWRTTLARAVEMVSRGEVHGATKELATALEGEGLDETSRRRLQRELARLESWEVARGKALESCVAEKKKVRIEHDGKVYVGVVQGVEENDFMLQPSSGAAVRLPLDDVEPAEMMKWISEKKVAIDDPATSAYVSLLAGTAHYKKLLEGDAAAVVSLREDATEYGSLRKEGEAVRRLEDLSRQPLPPTSDAAEKTLDEVKGLCLGFADTPCVADRRGALRELAAVALRRQFDEDPVAMMGLHGKVESLPNGRTRVSYEFDEPSELDDFVDDRHYLEEQRGEKRKVRTRSSESGFMVRKGNLAGLGEACIRHRLPLESPITLNWEMYWQNIDGASGQSPCDLDVDVCDDHQGDGLSYHCGAGLSAIDQKSGFADSSLKVFPWTLGTTYTFKVVHDGNAIEAFMNGSSHARIKVGPLASGQTVLWLHSDFPLYIKKLSIEGRVDRKGFAEPRAAWVDKRLVEMLGEH